MKGPVASILAVIMIGAAFAFSWSIRDSAARSESKGLRLMAGVVMLVSLGVLFFAGMAFLSVMLGPSPSMR